MIFIPFGDNIFHALLQKHYDKHKVKVIIIRRLFYFAMRACNQTDAFVSLGQQADNNSSRMDLHAEVHILQEPQNANFSIVKHHFSKLGRFLSTTYNAALRNSIRLLHQQVFEFTAKCSTLLITMHHFGIASVCYIRWILNSLKG